MKKCLQIASCLWLFSSAPLLAQTDWHLGGNTVSSSQTLGTNGNYSLILETNNTERARLTGAGLFGIGTTSPSAKLHINSASGQSPLRVQIGGTTKLIVNPESGGLAVGGAVIAPTNGLYVNGAVNIGTTSSPDYYKVNVVGTGKNYGGIKASAASVGVFGQGYGVDILGTGVIGEGAVIGVSGYGAQYGVEGRSTNFDGGFFYSDKGTGLRATTYNGKYAAIFEGDTYTSGTAYQSSDKNIKKNIQEMSNALSIINKLKPKHYEFRNDGQYASLNLPKGNHYGLLAQDVEEVLPELVKETAHQVVDSKATAAIQSTADGHLAPPRPVLRNRLESITIKGVNYTEMIPLLIAAVQEQQQTIEQLKQENSTFKKQFAKLELGTGSTIKLTPADLKGISLEQNHPNPTNLNTTFRYTIPKDATAQILVYQSTSGKLVKILPASASGQVEMNTTELEAGTYIYTLMVNGKQTAAKQMVLYK